MLSLRNLCVPHRRNISYFCRMFEKTINLWLFIWVYEILRLHMRTLSGEQSPFHKAEFAVSLRIIKNLLFIQKNRVCRLAHPVLHFYFSITFIITTAESALFNVPSGLKLPFPLPLIMPIPLKIAL